ncbi:unnamed protein product [Echinostoma caproni]|uniref:Transcriptional regulator n=1 Tax=Echinostoma caproni TaxID=27848 RepID=A0A183BDL7_9TREM|nr:unnamed protein product [Echinostoma caproni]
MVCEFYPMIERLSCGDWFTSRSAACSLISVVYPRVSKASRAHLREILQKLAM